MMFKMCPRCRKNKPIEQFGKLTRSKDGRSYYCRVCMSIIRKKSDEKHPGRYRKFIANNPEYEKKRYAKRMKDKRYELAALSANKGKSPRPCQICGSMKNLEAHHPDYSDLDYVIWLCHGHHKQLHAGWTMQEMLEVITR